GILVASTNANALGDTVGKTTVEFNAQLQLSNVTGTINEPLLLNGQASSADGALLNVAGNNTWGGSIEMDSDCVFVASTVNKGDTGLPISGQISDNGSGHSLTKVGTGEIVFSHQGGNTYRGNPGGTASTIIKNGILAIEDPLSLGAGA